MNNVNIDKSILSIARKILELEKRTLEHLINALNGSFEHIVHFLYHFWGKVIVADDGTSANVGRNVVATINSSGNVAAFLGAGNVIHGYIGIIEEDDTTICNSKSDNTHENKIILNRIQKFDHKFIDIISNLNL